MPMLARLIRQLPFALLSLVAAPVAWLALWLADACWVVWGRKKRPRETMPRAHAASVVIPNWNGRGLLEKYLPGLVRATARQADNEIIVVDNGSTDGSAEFVRAHFPGVRLVALDRNLGFGGGSNAGFRAAKNDIVVLLNSDMRVEEDFLEPLLGAFTDEKVFSVSCQIFFSDPGKRREETGLTQGWWAHGLMRVRHREDGAIKGVFPCFYGGGGSSAFDRRKFLELGGFDPLLRPFYLEDTDLGYMAWKRGWKVLYQPASKVWHEHRGTIGKAFGREYIEGVVRKNYLLFCWKNIHEPGRVAEHFFHAWAGGLASYFGGESLERSSFRALWQACLQLREAVRARWRARSLAVVSDTEALRRPMGAYFRDRYEPLPAAPERLNVLFVAPYAIAPPTHGGGVFMHEAVKQLGRLARLHLLVLVEARSEIAGHVALDGCAESMEFFVRREGKPKGVAQAAPAAVREFYDAEIEWLIHRQAFQKKIDVVQLEYTQLAQYAGPYRRLVWALFEHDVYFQSVARLMKSLGAWEKLKAGVEYLRALRWELGVLPRLDEIQTCTPANTRYLLSYLPKLAGRIHDGLRAGIDVASYPYREEGRMERTVLFLGSFRHKPNAAALEWMVEEVMPRLLREAPDAKLYVAGSDPPAHHTVRDLGGAVRIVGFVEDVRAELGRYAVFACPILSGSGVRVKLLEAFAAGIPCVSTRIGAEGLAEEDGVVCALADDAAGFAARIVDLFRKPGEARAMARRARALVAARHDAACMIQALEGVYRETVLKKRGAG